MDQFRVHSTCFTATPPISLKPSRRFKAWTNEHYPWFPLYPCWLVSLTRRQVLDVDGLRQEAPVHHQQGVDGLVHASGAQGVARPQTEPERKERAGGNTGPWGLPKTKTPPFKLGWLLSAPPVVDGFRTQMGVAQNLGENHRFRLLSQLSGFHFGPFFEPHANEEEHQER